VVDGEVKVVGRVPGVEEIKKMIVQGPGIRGQGSEVKSQ
jgi:hypothetical protein